MFSTPINDATLEVFTACAASQCSAFECWSLIPPSPPFPPNHRFTGRPLLSYIGDNSFIAVGSDSWASKARSFPGIITVSPRSPNSKISPRLSSSMRARISAADNAQDEAASSDRIQSLALCYGSAGCGHALEAIAHLSCFTYLHSHILEFQCLLRDAEAAVSTAASSAGVYWIEPKNALRPRNWSGKSIIGTGKSQTFAANAPNPSVVFNSISMSNSIIGVADSGVSRNNCYFCSNTGGSCASAEGSSSARNIHKYSPIQRSAQLFSDVFAMYWYQSSSDCRKCGRCGTRTPGSFPAQACGNGIDEDGHGTHTAGSLGNMLLSSEGCLTCHIWF